MKKFYLAMAVLVLSAMSLTAQVNVTMRVDMNQVATIADTVSVAGSFQAAAGFPSDWTPGTTILTDGDMDGVYEVTVSLPSGSYEYKFLNGPAWGTDEGVPGACQVNGNRGMTIGSNDTTLDVVCFGLCGPCPTNVDTFTVTLEVDMNNEDVGNDTACIAGSVQGAIVGGGFSNWTPGQTFLLDPDDDSVYSITFRIPEGSYEYKFLTGNAWGTDESVPSACATNNNRELAVSSDTTIRFCYGTCDEICTPPLPPVNVTFQVDMSDEFPSADGIFVGGSFQDPAWQKNVDEMTQVGSSDIYAFTTSIVPGEYQFLFFNGDYQITDPNNSDVHAETANFDMMGCGVPNGLGGYNRLLDIKGLTQDTVLPAFKYNTCDVTATSIGDDLNKTRSFTISPNPFEGFTTVSFSNPQGLAYNVEVMTMTGKVVKRINNLRDDNFRLEATNLPPGMYLISLSNQAGERYTAKAVVK